MLKEGYVDSLLFKQHTEHLLNKTQGEVKTPKKNPEMTQRVFKTDERSGCVRMLLLMCTERRRTL